MGGSGGSTICMANYEILTMGFTLPAVSRVTNVSNYSDLCTGHIFPTICSDTFQMFEMKSKTRNGLIYLSKYFVSGHIILHGVNISQLLCDV